MNVVCQVMSAGVNAILDVTWHQWSEGAALITDYGIAYFHLDVSVRPFVSALTKYLRGRDATDAILIFQNENGKFYVILFIILKILPRPI